MIMGMAYPAVQSAIREIDTKYDSGQLVEYFMTETSYRWFRFWLALSIFFALCCPFVLTCCKVAWVHYSWMFVHTLVVLLLLASSIKLYTIIMIYYRSGQLVEYVKLRAKKEKTKVASVLADIANFAASKGQKKVYMAAEQAIAEQLVYELHEQKYNIEPAEYDINNPSTFNSTLSEDTNRAIERMVEILTNRNSSSFFIADTTIVSLFYNIIDQHYMSQGLRDMIWRMVSEVSLSGNKEWIVAYWGIAEQYARSLKYNRIPKTETEAKQLCKEIMMMKEFHAAVGGMLIKYGKAKWLRDLLFFTNTQPASYPLLSNTFADVMDMIERLESRLRYPYLWTMQKHYLMHGVQNGVDTDADIVRYVEMFIAVEYLRLWHINYNGEYREPLGMLTEGNDAEENEKYLDLLECLQWCVNDVYDRNLNNTLNFHRPTKREAKEFINANVQIFKDKLEWINEHPEIDVDKRLKIIENVKKAAKEWKEAGDDVINTRFTEVQHFVRTMPHKFPKEYLLKNYSLSVASFGAEAVEGLKFYFSSVLPSFLIMRQATKNYTIAYEHIGEALRRLTLSDAYVILALGFNYSSYFEINKQYSAETVCKDDIWSFNGASFHDMLGRGESSLVIMRKDDVPMADIVENNTDKDAELITDSMPIYSNIRKVDEETYMNVFYRIYVDVHYPKDMKFVKIVIPNVFTSNRYDLDKVKQIDELIK